MGCMKRPESREEAVGDVQQLICLVMRGIMYVCILQEAWKQRRAPPADLSNLTAEEKLQRRNRMARYYSKLALERREALTAALEKEVVAQRIARDIVENAPGIALLTLSGDMGTTVLYANQAAASVLMLEPSMLLGR
jgi:PAS domain-containing protein